MTAKRSCRFLFLENSTCIRKILAERVMGFPQTDKFAGQKTVKASISSLFDEI
jgi:hypothetical protein